MNETKRFTCPHCREIGAGIDEISKCMVRTPMNGREGDTLQLDDLEQDVYEHLDWEYVCHSCGALLADTSDDMHDLLDELPEQESTT